jgi:hypothetical protein
MEMCQRLALQIPRASMMIISSTQCIQRDMPCKCPSSRLAELQFSFAAYCTYLEHPHHVQARPDTPKPHARKTSMTIVLEHPHYVQTSPDTPKPNSRKPL